MNNIFKHLKKILVHKYWVGRYCFKCGLYWQGITHDLSKFSPTEFCESIKYYMGTSSPINEAKRINGYSLAWQHHKGRNPHHYEYWTDNYDNGTTSIIMPYKYAVELACDYLGAARAYLGKDFSYKKEYQWWKEKEKHCAMHPTIKEFISDIFSNLNEINEDLILNSDYLKMIYDLYTND